MPTLTDREVIAGLKNPQRTGATTEFLYKKYFQSIGKLVRRHGGNRQDTEDLFQDTLLVFIEIVAQDRFDPAGKASLQTYFIGIAKNLLRKRQQRELKRDQWEQEYLTVYSQIDDIVRRYEDRLTAVHLLEQVGPACQEILVAFYLDDKSLDDIATALGKEVNALKVQKLRCVQKLKLIADSWILKK